MFNPHIPSRKEKNARKLKQNEFLPVMHAGGLNKWFLMVFIPFCVLVVVLGVCGWLTAF